MDGREALIRKVKRYARKVRGGITVNGFAASERVSTVWMYRAFPGGFAQLLHAAGLGDRLTRVRKANCEMCLEEVDRVAKRLGRAPARLELLRLGRFSWQTYYSRWGQYKNVLAAYALWKRARGAVLVDGPGSGDGTELPLAREAQSTPGKEGRGTVSAAVRPEGEGLTGQPLGFRGLVHAPTCESGVIHLFGLLGPELGIAVESIGVQFPDCRGLRHVPGSGGKWKRVAIEFELRSSNFKWHRHDAAKCDIIVCWENDWVDCPIEVISLKEEMRKLVGKGVAA